MTNTIGVYEQSPPSGGGGQGNTISLSKIALTKPAAVSGTFRLTLRGVSDLCAGVKTEGSTTLGAGALTSPVLSYIAHRPIKSPSACKPIYLWCFC